MLLQLRNNRGFTLAELLIAMAVMGIVAVAIGNLFISSQRTTVEQVNVTDIQANLRVAMDRISNDIRMAGFMVTGEPIPAATATGNSLTIRTASVTGQYARIGADVTADGTDALTVASDEMAQRFKSGDKVRLIRPPLLFQPDGDKTFDVTAVGTGTVTVSGLTAGLQVLRGDILVGTRAGIGAVNQITYLLSGDTLIRRVQGMGDQLITGNIAGLNFNYTLDADGLIKTVLVDIQGSTPPVTGANGKVRRLVSRVTVRNL